MSQIVWLINWTENENRDYHYSLWLTSIIEPWVISWLELSQIWSNVSITSWEAVVKVTRTSITPNEVFCVAFLSTATESVTINANDYVYVEINPTRVNDPALNVESTGTWIGQIVAWWTLPTNNYIILGRADGSWNIQTTWRQNVRLKQPMTSTDKITWWNWKILYTNWSGEVKELSFWTAGQVLWFTGVNSAPTPVSPTVDINSLVEDTSWDAENDFFVKYNWDNKKIKFKTYNANNTEAAAWVNESKYINSKQLHDNIKNQFWERSVKSFWVNYLADVSWIVTAVAKTTNSWHTIQLKWFFGWNPANNLVCFWPNGTDSDSRWIASVTFPVRKWEYYRIDYTTSNSLWENYFYFTPNI